MRTDQWIQDAFPEEMDFLEPSTLSNSTKNTSYNETHLRKDFTMLKAMIIDDENVDRCKKLLNVPNIGLRLIETPNWIIWTDEETPTAWTLPHVVFRDRYTVVGHEDENLLIERI